MHLKYRQKVCGAAQVQEFRVGLWRLSTYTAEMPGAAGNVLWPCSCPPAQGAPHPEISEGLLCAEAAPRVFPDTRLLSPLEEAPTLHQCPPSEPCVSVLNFKIGQVC